jgi:hypothetical protein
MGAQIRGQSSRHHGQTPFRHLMLIRSRFASGRAAKLIFCPSHLGDIFNLGTITCLVADFFIVASWRGGLPLFDVALDRFQGRAPIEAAEPDNERAAGLPRS